MAVDISNRDPKDPNGIYSLDTSATSDVWVNDDWSQIHYDAAAAKKAGAGNKVRMATAITNDGRKFNVIVGQDGKAISAVGDSTGYDDDRRAVWARENPTTRPTAVQEGDTRGPQTGPTREVYEGGQWVVKPNPLYQPDKPATRTPEQTQIDSANAQTAQQTAQNAAKLNAERDWHEQQGHGRYTHAEWEQKLDKDKADALAQGNQAEANRLQRERFEWDKQKAQLPQVNTQVVKVNGVEYIRAVSTKDGQVTGIKTYGPDGKEVPALPSEGAATAGGPPLPEIIVGSSERALREYHNALSKDPNLTPAQREKRFQEAVQTAQIAAQEAATQQRQREAELNASVNLASAKYSGMQTGQDNALKFVSDLNGKLPVGSNLGGQAFAALLGMNMLNAYGSGIMDVNVKSAFPTPAQLASARTPAEMETARQNVQAGLTQATTPAPQQNAGTGTGEPPSRAAVPPARPGTQTTIQPRPGAAAPTAAPQPATPEAQAMGAMPQDGRDWVYTRHKTHGYSQWTPREDVAAYPDSWEIVHDPKAQSAASAVPGLVGQPQAMAQQAVPFPTGPSGEPTFTGADDEGTRVHLPITSSDPDAGRWEPKPNRPPGWEWSGPRIDPAVIETWDRYYSPPRAPWGGDIRVPMSSGGGNVQMAPPAVPDFPVLAAAPAMAQQPLTPPIAQQSQQQDATPLPAMLYSEAAATPFWKMRPEDVERYRAAGVDEATIRSGTRLAGVA